MLDQLELSCAAEEVLAMHRSHLSIAVILILSIYHKRLKGLVAIECAVVLHTGTISAIQYHVVTSSVPDGRGHKLETR